LWTAHGSTVKKGHGGILTCEAPSGLKRGGAAAGYMGVSVMLIYFNKTALSTYKFNHPNIITLLQLVASSALLAVLCQLDIISLVKEPAVRARRRQSF